MSKTLEGYNLFLSQLTEDRKLNRNDFFKLKPFLCANKILVQKENYKFCF